MKDPLLIANSSSKNFFILKRNNTSLHVLIKIQKMLKKTIKGRILRYNRKNSAKNVKNKFITVFIAKNSNGIIYTLTTAATKRFMLNKSSVKITIRLTNLCYVFAKITFLAILIGCMRNVTQIIRKNNNVIFSI
jgi:hypothetical protein